MVDGPAVYAMYIPNIFMSYYHQRITSLMLLSHPRNPSASPAASLTSIIILTGEARLVVGNREVRGPVEPPKMYSGPGSEQNFDVCCSVEGYLEPNKFVAWLDLGPLHLECGTIRFGNFPTILKSHPCFTTLLG